MGYSGAGGKLIHEKNKSKKSRDTRFIYNSFFHESGSPGPLI